MDGLISTNLYEALADPGLVPGILEGLGVELGERRRVEGVLEMLKGL